ncbi:MAG TPA: sugar ABC transporter permease [Nocardioidaceae bacterium]|nr:sugar ABC transporter permease [Nocardioidaceae bacterium]
MSTATTAPAAQQPAPQAPRRTRGRRRSIRGAQAGAGWLFVSPAVVILLVFLVLPIILALYVSFTDWNGMTNPLSAGGAHWVGLDNYRELITEDGLTRNGFMTAVRNNFYFVLFVVPLQTALSLALAVLVNNRFLKGKGFFRTAFYFPSVTSSIAITLVFIFLFNPSGAVNVLLSKVGIDGPNWLIDEHGVFHNILGVFGVDSAPGWAQHQVLGLSIWEWFAGPSVGMCVLIVMLTWTTSGSFMLMFLAALQTISEDMDEAAAIDGATGWRLFRHVTLPMLRPTLVLVITLGLIGTWQIFDQIYLMGPNNQTIRTPAYFSYTESFANSAFGVGAAVAFLLFVLIVVLTLLQRRLLPEDIES